MTAICPKLDGTRGGDQQALARDHVFHFAKEGAVERVSAAGIEGQRLACVMVGVCVILPTQIGTKRAFPLVPSKSSPQRSVCTSRFI